MESRSSITVIKEPEKLKSSIRLAIVLGQGKWLVSWTIALELLPGSVFQNSSPDLSDVLAVLLFAEDHLDEVLEPLLDRNLHVDGVVEFLSCILSFGFLQIVC